MPLSPPTWASTRCSRRSTTLVNKPNRWINSGGLGTMGFGFPAAMGVKVSFPDHDVACVTGEGSIQMNIQELSTCLQYGLPVKIVNLNNGVLGMVRQWQDMATTVVTRTPTWSRCLISSSWPRPMARGYPHHQPEGPQAEAGRGVCHEGPPGVHRYRGVIPASTSIRCRSRMARCVTCG